MYSSGMEAKEMQIIHLKWPLWTALNQTHSRDAVLLRPNELLLFSDSNSTCLTETKTFNGAKPDVAFLPNQELNVDKQTVSEWLNLSRFFYFLD